LYSFAHVECRAGHLVEARTKIEEALKLIEFVRANVAGHELRASYFATMQDYYGLYIDILMRLHRQSPAASHDAAALHASERARARSLLELLTETGVNIRQGVDAELIAREQNLQQRINAKAEILLRLKSNQRTEGQASKLEKEIDTLTTEFQGVQVEIRRKGPRYAAL